MSKFFSILASHYLAIAMAGAIFAATGAQAGPSDSLRGTADSTPQAERPTTAPASEPTTRTQPIAIMHLSKKEFQIVRELHRHGIYW